MWTDPGNISVANGHMNVGNGTEAMQFLFREIHKFDFRYSAAQLLTARQHQNKSEAAQQRTERREKTTKHVLKSAE
jgi:hypothetical protein